jgi:hypothetical protein
MQVQHRALDLDTGLGRQPPGVQLEAVGRGQGDVAVFELGFSGVKAGRLGVEQQRTAAAEGQEQAGCRGFSSGETSQKGEQPAASGVSANTMLMIASRAGRSHRMFTGC